MFKREFNNSDLLNKSLSLKTLNCPWKVPEVCLSEVVRTMVFTFVCLILKLNRVSKWSMILYDPRTRNLSHLQFLVKSWSCRVDEKILRADYFEGCIGYFHYNEAVKRARLTLRITADENVFFHYFVWHGLNFLGIDLTRHLAFFWDWEGGNDRSSGVTKKKAGLAWQSIGKMHSHC